MGFLYSGFIRFYHFLAATREMAFIQAIGAAAITHEIAYQCTQNKIPGCGCPLPVSTYSHCGDNILFGEKKSRPFTDRLKKYHDAQTDLILHNNALGREVTNLRPYCYLEVFLCVLPLIYVYVIVTRSSIARANRRKAESPVFDYSKQVISLWQTGCSNKRRTIL